ncbi:hypothetical protein IAD21_02797 [Abditibacteriota bacterium]|nr:hypothetical protein IAD21_02797 [Abditibacteriota bacterium]
MYEASGLVPFIHFLAMSFFSTRRLLAFALPALWAAPLHAQELTPLDTAPAPLENKLAAATQNALAQGQLLLDQNDPAAVPLLRDTAQNALKALGTAAGSNALTLVSLPEDTVTQQLAISAIEAHALWGRAADQFGRRDEAITALVRAKTVLAATRVQPEGTLVRDLNLELNALLRNGLPLVAPDDVLNGIAVRAHENLWHTRRFDFTPASKSGLDALPKTGLLVTEGQLFPPAERNQSLIQIPPFYRPDPALNEVDKVNALDRLPGSLKLNRMIAGYSRVNSGPNAGQWRQAVRVFYASPFLTRDKRDDTPRAQKLAAQFLKVHALFDSQLGATNLYSRGVRDEGVTTLYLLEISALWPTDDDDPVVMANMGPKMPPVNSGPKPISLEAQVTPLEKPWQALAGQNEGAAPGEIMFWKAGMDRSEGEWVRELFHEYGHVALPPFGGFRPPLEPYSNGLLGETLGMMWAAQNPAALDLDATTDSRDDFLLHVKMQAVPARMAFLSADPTAPRMDGTVTGLKFLQGLTVVVERTYGAPLLGRVFAPLAQRSVGVQNIAVRRSLLNTQSLLDGLDGVMRTSFAAKKSLPIYLPAALNVTLDAEALSNRAPVALKSGASASGWIYVPAGATTLRVDAPNLSALGTPFKRDGAVTRLYMGGKTGWQKITLVASGATSIQNARFE